MSQYHLTDENDLVCHFADKDAQISYIKTTFNAIFIDVLGNSDVFVEYDATLSRYMAIIQAENGATNPTLRIRCESFMELVRTQTDSEVCCFIGLPTALSQFHVNFVALCFMMANQIDGRRKIVEPAEYRQPSNDFPDLPAEILKYHLDNGQFITFQNCCFDYLQRLSANHCLHEKINYKLPTEC